MSRRRIRRKGPKNLQEWGFSFLLAGVNKVANELAEELTEAVKEAEKAEERKIPKRYKKKAQDTEYRVIE